MDEMEEKVEKAKKKLIKGNLVQWAFSQEGKEKEAG